MAVRHRERVAALGVAGHLDLRLVALDLDLLQAVLDRRAAVLVHRQPVEDVRPGVLVGQDRRVLRRLAVRKHHHRDASRTLAVVVVVVVPDLLDRDLRRLCDVRVRHFDLVRVLTGLPDLADFALVALDLELLDGVRDLRAFLILRKPVPRVAPLRRFGQLNRRLEGFALAFLCLGHGRRLAVRRQRHADLLRTDAVLVVRVVPHLHHGDLHRLRLVCVLQLHRVDLVLFVVLDFAGLGLVARDRILREGVLDLVRFVLALRLRVLRKLLDDPAVFLILRQADVVQELAVRIQRHVDVVRTDAIPVIRVVPFLRDPDLDRLGLVCVLQVRDRADRLGLRRVLPKLGLILDPGVGELALRHALHHHGPVILFAQRVLRRDRHARGIQQFVLFERNRLAVDHLHQRHRQRFRTEARDVVLIVPHLQHFQAVPVGVVGVRDRRDRDTVHHLGGDVRHRVVAVLGDDRLCPAVRLQLAVHIHRQAAYRQRPGVPLLLVRDGLVVAIIRQHQLIVTRHAHVVGQQRHHDLRLRTLARGVIVVVPNLDHRGLRGDLLIVIGHLDLGRLFGVVGGQGDALRRDGRREIIASHLSLGFLLRHRIGAQRQVDPEGFLAVLDLDPVRLVAQVVAGQRIVVALAVLERDVEHLAVEHGILDRVVVLVVHGHSLRHLQLAADRVGDLEGDLRDLIRRDDLNVLAAEERLDLVRIGELGLAEQHFDFLHGVGDDLALIREDLQLSEALRGIPGSVLKFEGQGLAVRVRHGLIADVQTEDDIVVFRRLHAIPNLDHGDFGLGQNVLEVRRGAAGRLVDRQHLDGLCLVVGRDVDTAHDRLRLHDPIPDLGLGHGAGLIGRQHVLGQVDPMGCPLAVRARFGNRLRILTVGFRVGHRSCPGRPVEALLERERDGSVVDRIIDAGARQTGIGIGLVPILEGVQIDGLRLILVGEFNDFIALAEVDRGCENAVAVRLDADNHRLLALFIVGQTRDFGFGILGDGVGPLAFLVEGEFTEHTLVTDSQRQRGLLRQGDRFRLGSDGEGEGAGILRGVLGHALLHRDLGRDLAVDQLGQDDQGRFFLTFVGVLGDGHLLEDLLLALEPAFRHFLDPLVGVALARFVHLLHADGHVRPVVALVQRDVGLAVHRLPLGLFGLGIAGGPHQGHLQRQILVRIGLTVDQPLLRHGDAELAGGVGVEQSRLGDLAAAALHGLTDAGRGRLILTHRHDVDDPAQVLQPGHRAHVGVRLRAFAGRFAFGRDLSHGVHADGQVLHAHGRAGIDREELRLAVFLRQGAVLVGHIQRRAVDNRGHHSVEDLVGIVFGLVLAVHEHALVDRQLAGLQRVGHGDLPDLIRFVVFKPAVRGGVAAHGRLGHLVGDSLALLLDRQVGPGDRQIRTLGVRGNGLVRVRNRQDVVHTVHRVGAAQRQGDRLPQGGVAVVVPDLRRLDGRGLGRVLVGDVAVFVVLDFVAGFLDRGFVFLHRVFDRLGRILVGELRQIAEGHGVGVVAVIGDGRLGVGYLVAVRVQTDEIRVLLSRPADAVLVVRVVPGLGDLDLCRGLVAVGDDGTGDRLAVHVKRVLGVGHGVGHVGHGDLAVHHVQLDHGVGDLLTVDELRQFGPADFRVLNDAGLVAAFDKHGDIVIAVGADQAQGHGLTLVLGILVVLPDLPGIDFHGLGLVGIGDGVGEGIAFLLDGHGVDEVLIHRDLAAIRILGAVNHLDHGVVVGLHLRRLAVGPVVLVQVGPGVGPLVFGVQGDRGALLLAVLVELHADVRPPAVPIVLVGPDLGHGDLGLRFILVGDLPGIGGLVHQRGRALRLLVVLVQLNRHELLDRVGDRLASLVLREVLKRVRPVVVFGQHLLSHGLLVRARSLVKDDRHALQTHFVRIVEVVPDLGDRHLNGIGLVAVGDVVAFLGIAGDGLNGVLGAVEVDLVALSDRIAFRVRLDDRVFDLVALGGLLIQIDPDVGPVVLPLEFDQGNGRIQRDRRLADLGLEQHEHIIRGPLAILVVAVLPQLRDRHGGLAGRVGVGQRRHGAVDGGPGQAVALGQAVLGLDPVVGDLIARIVILGQVLNGLRPVVVGSEDHIGDRGAVHVHSPGLARVQRDGQGLGTDARLVVVILPCLDDGRFGHHGTVLVGHGHGGLAVRGHFGVGSLGMLDGLAGAHLVGGLRQRVAGRIRELDFLDHLIGAFRQVLPLNAALGVGDLDPVRILAGHRAVEGIVVALPVLHGNQVNHLRRQIVGKTLDLLDDLQLAGLVLVLDLKLRRSVIGDGGDELAFLLGDLHDHLVRDGIAFPVHVIGHAGRAALGLGDAVLVLTDLGVGDLFEAALLAVLDLDGEGRLLRHRCIRGVNGRQREHEELVRVIARRVLIARHRLGHLGLIRHDKVLVGDGQGRAGLVAVFILGLRDRQVALRVGFHGDHELLVRRVVGHVVGLVRSCGLGLLDDVGIHTGRVKADGAEDPGLAVPDLHLGLAADREFVAGETGSVVKHGFRAGDGELELFVRIVGGLVGIAGHLLGHLGLRGDLVVGQLGQEDQNGGDSRVAAALGDLLLLDHFGGRLSPAGGNGVLHPVVLIAVAVLVHLLHADSDIGPVVGRVQRDLRLTGHGSPLAVVLRDQLALQVDRQAQGFVRIGLAVDLPLLGHRQAELAGGVSVDQFDLRGLALADDGGILRAAEVEQPGHRAHIAGRVVRVRDDRVLIRELGHDVRVVHGQADELHRLAGLQLIAERGALGDLFQPDEFIRVRSCVVGRANVVLDAFDRGGQLEEEALFRIFIGLVLTVDEDLLVQFQLAGVAGVGDLQIVLQLADDAAVDVVRPLGGHAFRGRLHHGDGHAHGQAADGLARVALDLQRRYAVGELHGLVFGRAGSGHGEAEVGGAVLVIVVDVRIRIDREGVLRVLVALQRALHRLDDGHVVHFAFVREGHGHRALVNGLGGGVIRDRAGDAGRRVSLCLSAVDGIGDLVALGGSGLLHGVAGADGQAGQLHAVAAVQFHSGLAVLHFHAAVDAVGQVRVVLVLQHDLEGERLTQIGRVVTDDGLADLQFARLELIRDLDGRDGVHVGDGRPGLVAFLLPLDLGDHEVAVLIVRVLLPLGRHLDDAIGGVVHHAGQRAGRCNLAHTVDERAGGGDAVDPQGAGLVDHYLNVVGTVRLLPVAERNITAVCCRINRRIRAIVGALPQLKLRVEIRIGHAFLGLDPLRDRDLDLRRAVDQLGQEDPLRGRLVVRRALGHVRVLDQLLRADRIMAVVGALAEVFHTVDPQDLAVLVQLDPAVAVLGTVRIHLVHADGDRGPVVGLGQDDGADGAVRLAVVGIRLAQIQRRGHPAVHIRRGRRPLEAHGHLGVVRRDGHLAVDHPLLRHRDAVQAARVRVDERGFGRLIRRGFGIVRDHRRAVRHAGQVGQEGHAADRRILALAKGRAVFILDLGHGVFAHGDVLEFERRPGRDGQGGGFGGEFAVHIQVQGLFRLIAGRGIDHGVRIGDLHVEDAVPVDLALGGVGRLGDLLAVDEQVLAHLQGAQIKRIGDRGLPDFGRLVERAFLGDLHRVPFGHVNFDHLVGDLIARIVLGQILPVSLPGFDLAVLVGGAVEHDIADQAFAQRGDIADLILVRFGDGLVVLVVGRIAVVVQDRLIHRVFRDQAEGERLGTQAELVVIVYPDLLGLGLGILLLVRVGHGRDDHDLIDAGDRVVLGDLGGAGIGRPALGTLVDLGRAVEDILLPGVGELVAVDIAARHAAHQVHPAVRVVQFDARVGRGLLQGLVLADIGDAVAAACLDIAVALGVIVDSRNRTGLGIGDLRGLVEVGIDGLRTDAVAVVLVVPDLGNGHAVVGDVGVGEDDLGGLHAFFRHNADRVAGHLGQLIAAGHTALVLDKRIVRAGRQTVDGEVVVRRDVESDVAGRMIGRRRQLLVVILGLQEGNRAGHAVGDALHLAHDRLIGNLTGLRIGVLLPEEEVEHEVGIGRVRAADLLFDGQAVLGFAVDEPDAGHKRAVLTGAAVGPAHGAGNRLERARVDAGFVSLVGTVVDGRGQRRRIRHLIQCQLGRIHHKDKVLAAGYSVDMRLNDVNRVVVGNAVQMRLRGLTHAEVVVAGRVERHLAEGDRVILVPGCTDEVPDDLFLGLALGDGSVVVRLRYFIAEHLKGELENLVIGGCHAIDGLSGVHVAVEAQQRAALVGGEVALSRGVDAVDDHGAVEVAAGDDSIGARRDHMAELRIAIPSIEFTRIGIVVDDGDAVTVVHRAGKAAVDRLQLRDAVLSGTGEADDCAGKIREGLVQHVQLDGDVAVFRVHAFRIFHPDLFTGGHIDGCCSCVLNRHFPLRVAVQSAGLTDHAALERAPVDIVAVRDRLAPGGQVNKLSVEEDVTVEARVDLTHIEVVVRRTGLVLTAADNRTNIGQGDIRNNGTAYSRRSRGFIAAADIDIPVNDQVAADQDAGHGVLIVHEIAVAPGGATVGVAAVRVGTNRDDVELGQQILQRVVRHAVVVLPEIYIVGVDVVLEGTLDRIRIRIKLTVVDGGIGNHFVSVNIAADGNSLVPDIIRVVHRGSCRHARQRHGHIALVTTDHVGTGHEIAVRFLEPVFVGNPHRVGFTAIRRVIGGDLRVRVKMVVAGRRNMHQSVDIHTRGERERLAAAVQFHIIIGGVGNTQVNGSFIRRHTDLPREGIALGVTGGEAVGLGVEVRPGRRCVLIFVADTNTGTGGGHRVAGCPGLSIVYGVAAGNAVSHIRHRLIEHGEFRDDSAVDGGVAGDGGDSKAHILTVLVAEQHTRESVLGVQGRSTFGYTGSHKVSIRIVLGMVILRTELQVYEITILFNCLIVIVTARLMFPVVDGVQTEIRAVHELSLYRDQVVIIPVHPGITGNVTAGIIDQVKLFLSALILSKGYIHAVVELRGEHTVAHGDGRNTLYTAAPSIKHHGIIVTAGAGGGINSRSV